MAARLIAWTRQALSDRSVGKDWNIAQREPRVRIATDEVLALGEADSSRTPDEPALARHALFAGSVPWPPPHRYARQMIGRMRQYTFGMADRAMESSCD